MHPARKRRLYLILALVIGVSIATGLVLKAMTSNINLFYPPRDVVSGKAPENTTIRLGGVVKEGSVHRDSKTLKVDFIVTDGTGDVPVTYEGILPDLFEEGQAAVAVGSLHNGVFEATQVLAKHDENYTPPEVQDAVAEHKRATQS